MRVTIRAVAEKAGTSIAAVSATLNGNRTGTIRVGDATRERIFQAAAAIGYVPNPIAKSLATGKTKVIGLMLPYADAFVDQNPFCAQVMSGIMRDVVDERYNVMLYTATSGMPPSEAAALVDSRVDGLLLVMPPDDSAVFARCEHHGIPYVSILRHPVESAFTVNSDDYRGGYIATEHLLSLGHKRIAHLIGSQDVVTSQPRLNGYRDALRAAGVQRDERHEVQAGFTWRHGHQAMSGMLKLPPEIRPTGVFAANDLCAQGAIRAIDEAGLSVPEDYAVVGYDDTWHATATVPPLTSVHMPIAEMGALAARMLISIVEGRPVAEAHPKLPVSLTIRQSSVGKAPRDLVHGATSPLSHQS